MENIPLVANPLLDLTQPPRFSAILPAHVSPALDQVLAENRAGLAQLIAGGSSPTWENFVQPIEDMRERLVRVWSTVSHLHAVMDSKPWREVYNAGLPRVTDYFTELAQDERVYAGYRSIAASPEMARLSQAQKKIIENTLRDFRLAGAELPAMKQARFKILQQEMAALRSKFSENVLDATQAWDLVITDVKDLAGLPESARAMAKQDAREKNLAGWRFTLEGPSYINFMTYADNREKRRRMYEAYVTRASDRGPDAGRWDNTGLIVDLLRLRRESAQLLGLANFAEYALQTRMAKTVSEVMHFLNDLAARSRPAAKKEYDELVSYARTAHGVDHLEAWDVAYYSDKLQQAKHNFSQEDLRPYFPETRVVPGLFEVVKRLYGLTVTEIKDIEAWHPDVHGYEIRDRADELRGMFYIDLYARANKRGGAWMDECIQRKRTAHGVQVPVAHLVCNFSPPVEGRPALFTHEEVITLFHEFGHGLHHMLTRVDYVGVSGINGVAWDAVELPSQFMENWCWERQALDLISGHYQSHEKIPAGLYARMIAAKNFQSGMQFARQLEYALFDMRLHSNHDPERGASVQQLLDEIRAAVAVIIPPAFNRFQNSFSHVFAGSYAAGYYSYKWAEVLSADAFSKFEENGVFDRATGLEFMRNILEQGGSREPMELFVNFRGRAPRMDALLRHSGLTA
ncbi:MAG TPA: M3 family metallopeptidase [Sulfuricaulis sp.]|nr:M3 family metallopeptidase [Sulfuricaulis sp.]